MRFVFDQRVAAAGGHRKAVKYAHVGTGLNEKI